MENENPEQELDNSTDPFGLGWSLPEGHLTYEDEVLIRKYTKGLCVNLGTFKGRSAIIMSYYADQVITIDKYVAPEFVHEDVVGWLKNYSNIIPVKALSNEYAINFDNKSIDFLFVDAGHSKGEIIADYSAYYSKLKDDAVVIFHDWKYMDGKTDESMDVQGGVRKLLEDNILKEIEKTGWCFVGRKYEGRSV